MQQHIPSRMFCEIKEFETVELTKYEYVCLCHTNMKNRYALRTCG